MAPCGYLETSPVATWKPVKFEDLRPKPELEGVVAQWSSPLTLQTDGSGGMGSIPGRAPPPERRGHGFN